MSIISPDPLDHAAVFGVFLDTLDAPQQPPPDQRFQVISGFLRDFAGQQGVATPQQWEDFRGRVGRILDFVELQRLQADVPLPLTFRVTGPDRSLIVPIARWDAVLGSAYREAVMWEAGMQVEAINLQDLPPQAFEALQALLEGHDAALSIEDAVPLLIIADRLDAVPLQEAVLERYSRGMPVGKNGPRHAAMVVAQEAMERGWTEEAAMIMEIGAMRDPSVQRLVSAVQTATTEQQCLAVVRQLSMADATVFKAMASRFTQQPPAPTTLVAAIRDLSNTVLRAVGLLKPSVPDLQQATTRDKLVAVVRDLSTVDEPTLARIQHAFHEQDIGPALQAWCEEVSDTPEFERRQWASSRIEMAFRSQSTGLMLEGKLLQDGSPEAPLTTVPDCIGYLPHLKSLTLFQNQLTDLPESIGRLSLLTNLEVNDNQLTSLPACFRQLTNLTWLWSLDKTVCICLGIVQPPTPALATLGWVTSPRY